MDILDAHAGLLPFHLLVHKVHHRVAPRHYDDTHYMVQSGI